MKQTRTAHSMARNALKLIAITALLAGCAEWSSRPSRVEQDFGNSVREMIQAQTYNPERALNPNPEPVKTLDGKKGQLVIEKAYRQDVARPQEVKQNIIFNIGGSK